MRRKSRVREQLKASESSISNKQSSESRHNSSRKTPPRPIYKSKLLDQVKQLGREQDPDEQEPALKPSDRHIDIPGVSESLYQPTLTLFDDEYKPYCSRSAVIKIEDIEPVNHQLPSKAKDYNSHTTTAETCNPVTLGPSLLAIDQANFGITGHQEYFSSKFGKEEEDFAGLGYPPQPSEGQAEEDKSITKRLKNLVKQLSTEVKKIDQKQVPEQNSNARQWNSLGGQYARDEPKNSTEGGEFEVHNSRNESEHPISHQSLPTESYMVALYDFAGEKSKDLSFRRGDLVRLIDKKSNGWWLAEVEGRIGFVPSNYLVSRQEVNHN